MRLLHKASLKIDMDQFLRFRLSSVMTFKVEINLNANYNFGTQKIHKYKQHRKKGMLLYYFKENCAIFHIKSVLLPLDYVERCKTIHL